MVKSITPGLHRQVGAMGLQPIVCSCGCNVFCAGMDLNQTNETAGDIRMSCVACGNWTLWFRPMRTSKLMDAADEQAIPPRKTEAKGLN